MSGLSDCLATTSTTVSTNTSTTFVVTISTKSYHLLSIYYVPSTVLIKSLHRICAEPHNSLDEAEQQCIICWHQANQCTDTI